MKGTVLFFRTNIRDRIATLESDAAESTAKINEMNRQIGDLQTVVQALVVTNQQMIKDMKTIYDSLTAIAGTGEISGLDKYFMSIINNSGGSNLPH
tara:strand:- start:159 stop:446 length:288 start_codon:yes stop_codon:yes gene_type:complete